MSTIQSRRPEKKAIKKHCKVNPKIPMKILFDQKTAQLLKLHKVIYSAIVPGANGLNPHYQNHSNEDYF